MKSRNGKEIELTADGKMVGTTFTYEDTGKRIPSPYPQNNESYRQYKQRVDALVEEGFHLGDLTQRFGGSMLLTTVGYNAGPARPRQWIERCGDPRAGSGSNVVDAIDFIECAPFTETRNYMMRVMENMQICRARLNGGTAPLQLSSDISRGAAVNSGPQPYMSVSEGEITPQGEPTE